MKFKIGDRRDGKRIVEVQNHGRELAIFDESGRCVGAIVYVGNQCQVRAIEVIGCGWGEITQGPPVPCGEEANADPESTCGRVGTETNLTGANLTGADLRDADLTDANPSEWARVVVAKGAKS